MPPAFPPRLVASLIAACGLMGGPSASAQSQTYFFQAVVDSVESTSTAFADRNLGLVAGDTITGTIVIDLSSPDTVPGDTQFGIYRNYDTGSVNVFNPDTGSYNLLPRLFNASLAMDLPKGNIEFGAISNHIGNSTTFDTHEEGRAPRINVSDGTSYVTESSKLGTATGDSLNFYQKIQIASSSGGYRGSRTVDFLLNDPAGTAFDSDALPASLNLGRFDNAKIYFEIIETPFTISYPGVEAIRGSAGFTSHITCLTAVPEPSAPALCAVAGLILLGFRRRARGEP